MTCSCGGTIIKNEYLGFLGFAYAECKQCYKLYTWKEYRALQAEKIVEMVIKEETPCK